MILNPHIVTKSYTKYHLFLPSHFEATTSSVIGPFPGPGYCCFSLPQAVTSHAGETHEWYCPYYSMIHIGEYIQNMALYLYFSHKSDTSWMLALNLSILPMTSQALNQHYQWGRRSEASVFRGPVLPGGLNVNTKAHTNDSIQSK